jgi:hypothetical protein
MKKTLFSSSIVMRTQNLRHQTNRHQIQLQKLSFLIIQRRNSTKIEKNVEKDIQMPTPLSLGFDIKYQAAPISASVRQKRTIAIVAGWMGAKEKQLKPYLKFYHDRGIDTISFAVG